LERRLSILRSVSWNYLGYFCEFGSGVLLLAYVVRRIPVEDYGIYLLAQSLAGFLFVLEFGLGNVLVPLYVSTFAANGIEEVGRLASTLVLALLGLGTLGASALSLAALLVPQMIRLPSAHVAVAVRVLIVSSAAVSLMLPQMALEQLCQAFHRFDRLNQVQIAMTALRVAATVAVLGAGRGILGLAAAQALVSLLRLVSLWAVAGRGIRGLSLKLFCFNAFRLCDAMRLSRVGRRWPGAHGVWHRLRCLRPARWFR
jgi:O-antigen/teichoic acid export membrane protein